MTTHSQYEKKKILTTRLFWGGFTSFISVIILRWKIYSYLDGWNFDGLATDKLFKYLLWNIQHRFGPCKMYFCFVLRFIITNTLQIQITNKNIKLFVVSVYLSSSRYVFVYAVAIILQQITSQKSSNVKNK